MNVYLDFHVYLAIIASEICLIKLFFTLKTKAFFRLNKGSALFLACILFIKNSNRVIIS